MNDDEMREAYRALTAHLTEQLGRLLPERLGLVQHQPDSLLLTERVAGGPRAVHTHTMARADRIDISLLAGTTQLALSEIQDAVTLFLATPWPLSDSGRPLHPAVRVVQDRVQAGYYAGGRFGADGITLEPWAPPPA